MSLTLSYSGTTLALPDDLRWPDEYAWQAVAQSTAHSITGALLRQATAKQSGQPVTLAGAPDAAWIDRATLDTLRTWASVAGRVMTLAGLRGASRSVVFDHAAGAIDAAPLIDYSEPVSTDRYIVTLRFLTVPTP